MHWLFNCRKEKTPTGFILKSTGFMILGKKKRFQLVLYLNPLAL